MYDGLKISHLHVFVLKVKSWDFPVEKSAWGFAMTCMIGMEKQAKALCDLC